MPETVYIGLGSNLGDRLSALAAAVESLTTVALADSLFLSSVYESQAHVRDNRENDPDFLNQVIMFDTRLDPGEVLEACLATERHMGRVRNPGERWFPRTIDIDLLVFGQRTISTEALQVPHPRIPERRFVLEPLAEIDPDLLIPFPIGKRVAELLDQCPDRKEISHYLIAS